MDDSAQPAGWMNWRSSPGGTRPEERAIRDHGWVRPNGQHPLGDVLVGGWDAVPYPVGRFGQFEDTDAEPGVSLTSAAEAVAGAVGETVLDRLVVQGRLAVHRSDSSVDDNEDEATGSEPR
jgi:hypothetical protein